jgi:hypothetical protein
MSSTARKPTASKPTASTLTGLSAGEPGICVIIFSGKKNDWENWKVKLVVRAYICGYHAILPGIKSVPDTCTEDGTKETLSKTDQGTETSNIKGFGNLFLSIDTSTSAGKVAFAMITYIKTKKNPEGNISAAFLCLKNKYKPITTPHLMQLAKAFHSKSLGKNQDPDTFITDLETRQVQISDCDHKIIDKVQLAYCDNKIKDKALFIHVLNNSNDNYEMEVKLLEHNIQLLQEFNK